MRTFEQVLRWIVIVGAYLLPFVVFYVAGSLFFPFITGKNFYFRIVVEIMAASWLSLAIILPQYRPRKNWALAAFAAFVLIMAIADAQGANPFKSFWSNFERMDGWVTLAHLLIYLTVVVSVLNTEKLWRRLFQLSLILSVIIGFKGVSQLLGWSAIGQGGTTGLEARLDATFGNAIYLAVYDLFHVFIAALLWAQEWHERRPGKRTWISICYGFVILFDTFILLFTGTRGTTLGLIGGGMLAGVIYVSRAENTRGIRNYVFGALAVLVVISGTLYAARDTSFVNNIGFLTRLAHISVNDPTVQSRFLNVGMAWKGVQERPLLGWGQENYAIVFDKYYDPRMYNAEPWFDRVHNSFFDWFVAGGILGIASYLAIFGALLWYLWTSRGFKLYESVILIGLFVGYFFHNLFVFDNVSSYILFATMLGYVIWRESEARKTDRVVQKQFIPTPGLGFSAAGAFILIGALGWWTNVPAIDQNHVLIQALMDGGRGNYDKALTDFQTAANINALGTQEVREQLAQAAAQVSGSNLSADLKQKYIQTAVAEMNKQEQMSPLDARFPLFLGLIYQSSGDTADAQKAFDLAHKLSPTKQTILYEMGQNALSRGDIQSAIDAFKQAYELETDNIEARLYYAALLIRAGQDTLADQLLAPVIPTGQAADSRIDAAYAARGEYNKIVAIWEARVLARPDDSSAYFTLSAAYYAAGDKAKAIQTLQDVSQKIPSASDQAQQYITQIQNGTIAKPQ
jgi:tetratricopeptide (TPR) repeat protein/O-antigen ligase